MKNFCLFVFFLLFIVFIKNAEAQNVSNEGREFWTAFPTHDASSTLAVMNINITAKNTSQVTVSCGSYSETKSIPANTVVSFIVPRSESYIDQNDSNLPLSNRGIHIVVPLNQPKVVAYSHVFASNRSAATLILPFDALGQKYFSMNYTQDQDRGRGGPIGVSRNFLTLIAVEDDTDLVLTTPDGNVLPIRLNKKGDIYQYMPLAIGDLTGVSVEVDPDKSSCKRFAAFSGSTSISIGCTNSRDPLLQQLYSVNSWGKVYGLVPFINRQYIFRVLAQENNTTIELDGRLLGVLNKGQYYEQVLVRPAIISADKLISVAEYSFTEDCSSISGDKMTFGDPEMVLLNPVEFNIKNITLFSSNDSDIREKYINVFMKTDKTATFKLNGRNPTNGSWQFMPSNAIYSYIQIQVTEASLILSADDGFNAIAYGFGPTESYAYSAGTNLASSSTLSLLNVGSGIINSSTACLGQLTLPKLTVPYQLTKITWDFNDGTPTQIDADLKDPEITFDNFGVQQYTYTFSTGRIFTEPRTYLITVVAMLSVKDLPPCFDGTDLVFNFEIEAVSLAKAKFVTPDICAGKAVQFFDLSEVTGGVISQWRWSFDGELVATQNPIHTFDKGQHIVKLSVANSSGCWSDIFEQTFSVSEDFPRLEFNKPRAVCINDSPLQIIASEKQGLKVLKSSFTGKGISSTGMFNPLDAKVGIHKITYTFTSVGNCTDSISQDIEVYESPRVNTISTIYILTGGQRKIPLVIENLNPKYNYKYKWFPSVGLDKDDILNPIASPDIDTEYTLTVSIDGMCDVSSKVLVNILGEIRAPNAFSPNGDGINDTWEIKSIDSYPNITVEIFNRSGQRVFSSIGYSIPFDGTYRNQSLPVGIYYYIMNPRNGRKVITGSLTLIK